MEVGQGARAFLGAIAAGWCRIESAWRLSLQWLLFGLAKDRGLRQSDTQMCLNIIGVCKMCGPSLAMY